MTPKEKRIAWVTGGGSGIGLAGAEALAADGWTVAISGRRFDVLADAAKRIGDKNSRTVDVFPVDVTRADDVQAVARSILAKYGQIDLLVNNAGTRRSCDSHYEAASGTPLGRSHVENAPTGGRWADDRVRGEHASACLRQ